MGDMRIATHRHGLLMGRNSAEMTMYKKLWLTVLVSVLVLSLAVWMFAHLLAGHRASSPRICNLSTSSGS